MSDFDFSKIVYRKPSAGVGNRTITDLIGLDSEAYGDGKPFMFCFSDGRVCTPEEFPAILFTRQYRNKQFIVWNLRYEAGALLRNLPRRALLTLRDTQKATHHGYAYKYYPHKFLRISMGKNSATFWDGAGFYQMSLQEASEKYLGRSKLDQKVKGLTRAYVERHWTALARYCIQDGVLTRDLGLYLLKYLGEFGIAPSALYSQASISYLYFKRTCGIVDVWRYWMTCRRLLNLACDSYTGGKFEMTRRGRFEGEMWDISGAYPHAISTLIDITDAHVAHSTTYQPEADYAFLDVDLDIPPDIHSPIAVKHRGINTFPVGYFRRTITKVEYDYLFEHRVPMRIREAYWLTCATRRRPYEKVVQHLYHMKELAGEADVFRYDLAKKLNNGFYGKMVQLIEAPDGTLRAGPGWNPIYGAHITASVRVQMCRAQEYLGPDCYAVHTDSVLTRRPIPRSWKSQDLGGWKLKRSGEGVIIATGIYEHAGKCANRGFRMKPEFSWIGELKRAGTKSVLDLTEHRPLSWIGAVNTGHVDRINRFMTFEKRVDLNQDVKRIWMGRADARTLLNGSQSSAPRVHVEGHR